jgi:hypothetical protein
MRRALGYAAFTFGCMLIFLAPLLYFYATPRVEKAPYDVDDTSVSIGSGSYFSVKTLSVVGPAPLKNISTARGFPERSTEDVAVIGIFSRTLDLTRGDFDYGYSVYAFDRSTGYAVPSKWAKPPAEGLTLKFPFHTEKGTYRFWDSSAQRAFPATYTRTETVDGLDAYVFVSHVPPTILRSMEVPGGIVGQPAVKSVVTFRYYDATTTLWVEPFTGAILKAGQHSRQWLTDGAGTRLLTLADVDVVNDAPSVQSVVDQIKGKLWQLRLVSLWFPIGAPILGVLVLIVGLALVRVADRSERAEGTVVGPAVAPAQVG